MKGGYLFKMENKHLAILLAIAILVVGYFAFGSSNASVSAQGVSVIKASPDKVSIYFNVEGRGDTAQEAKRSHDEIIDKLFVELIRVGLDRDEIKTVNYNIYPEYDWSDGKQTQKGYLAQQGIVVEIENFDSVAEIVDAGVEAGALVSYIQFELSEEKQSEYKIQALEQAGQDAKKKAEATARGLGKNLGSLLSVNSEEFNYGPFRYFEASGAGSVTEAKDAALNIAPQDLEVTAYVSVEYKLRAF